jgi:peptide/histidine transporter 3/4
MVYRFLDKACVKTNTGGEGDGPWSVCSAAKVEETKIVLRMLPLVFSSTVAHVSSSLLIAFTVQQGATTNTKLGKVHVYPAMLFIIPSIFQTLMLVAYDQLLVPLLRRRTGYTGGITQLQRVAVGFLASSIAPAVAAVVERKRKGTVAAGGHISLFWLEPQFFLIGVEDTTSFVGLLEFFTAETPDAMKSIGVAFFWCQAGMASLLGTLLVRLVNRVTHSSSAPGWLEGKDLNSSHLDLFYWVVTAVSFLGWINYLYWAKRYKYRQDPRISTKSSDEDGYMP